MDEPQLQELLYQMLETELGGVQVYEQAVACAKNDDLRQEWQKYYEQTTHHVEIVQGLLTKFGLDPEEESPGRLVVRHIGGSLVKAMKMAQEDGNETAAELVAAECVTLAETKDHLNWELLSSICTEIDADKRDAVSSAVAEVEEQEDEHLYHTTGWARELWLQSLGVDAALPPPEEQKHVHTEIGAARAKQTREAFV